MTENHLSRINKLDSLFVFSLQTGKWDATTQGLLEKIPTPAQFLYTMNMGLLYGAKGIDISNYFYKFNSYDDTTDKTALYNHYDDYYTPLWFTIRDAASPLLKGLFGKTLRNISQTQQIPNRNLSNTPLSISGNHHLDKLRSLSTEATLHVADVGFFRQFQSSSFPEYVMLVNRWYSSESAVQVYLKNLSDYKNWSIKNLIDTTYNFVTAGTENKANFDDVIHPGDAALYEIFPVAKVGGILQASEIINQNTTLEDNLTITSGDTLYINAVYTLRDTIFVEDGGFVKVQHGGAIVFEGNGALVYEDWSDCLVINQNTTHPKLIWQKYGSGYQYKIYRKKDTPAFTEVATITADTITSYTDNGVTINLGAPQSNETVADYYVIVGDVPSRTWVSYDTTNTVRVTRVEGNQQEKAAAGSEHKITEYNLEQNYPNPFNPITIIRYQVPKDSKVTLTVYDILGTEVALLVDAVKPMGSYEVMFDAATAGGGLASGMYIYKLQAGNYNKVRKMILLK